MLLPIINGAAAAPKDAVAFVYAEKLPAFNWSFILATITVSKTAHTALERADASNTVTKATTMFDEYPNKTIAIIPTKIIPPIKAIK
jgi:hypothetical protein